MISLGKVLELKEENKLKRGESEEIQHKESFSDKPQIIKTMAGMANNKGGYIVIGVEDKTQSIKALKPESLKSFNNMQGNGFPNDVKEALAPDFEWNHLLKNDLGIGIIVVQESKNKPIIAKKNWGNNTIKEGEIYYSYKDRVEKIKYEQMLLLIDRIKENERNFQDKKYKDLLKQISMFGIDNTGTLCKNEIKSPNFNFIIDKNNLEELKRKIKFIEEGNFKEKGKPTLKLIGDLIQVPTIEKEKIIKESSLDGFCKNADELNWKIFNNETINYSEYVSSWFEVANILPSRNVSVFTLKSKIDENTFNKANKFKANYDNRFKKIKVILSKCNFEIENKINDEYINLLNEITGTKKEEFNKLINVIEHCLKSRLNNKITTQSLKEFLSKIYTKNQGVLKNSIFRKALVIYDFIFNKEVNK